MAKLASCKCKKCGKQLAKDEKHIHSGKTYCKKCYDVVTLQATQFKELIDYVCKLFELDRPDGFMLKQIKEFHDENGWPYSGITYTIWYSIEILGVRPIQKYGLYFVRNNYNEALQYFMRQQESIEKMKSLDNAKESIRIVTNTSRKKETSTTLFDLNNLIGGG